MYYLKPFGHALEEYATRARLVFSWAAAVGAATAALYALALGSGNDDWLVLADTVLPIALTAGAASCAYALIHDRHLLLLTPLPWFFLACAAYYGVGPLVYHFGNDATVGLAHAFFDVDEIALARTNLLNAVGISIICTVVALGYRRAMPAPRDGTTVGLPTLKRLIVLFLVIGLPIKYLVTLPSYFGLIKEVPGSVQQLAMSTSLALFLCAYLLAAGRLRFSLWIGAFFASEILVSLLTFSKMESLVAILMILLGAFAARPRLRALLVSGVAAVALYVYMVPAVLAMREQIASQPSAAAGYEVRAAVLSQYIFGDGDRSVSQSGNDDDSAQLWWFRLDYANSQAFAMRQYDAGSSGDTLDGIAYALIPRVLWPDKPTLSVGTQFNDLITGNDESNSSPGIFAEAYWNAGWPMVVLICIYVGVLFVAFTSRSLRCFVTQDFRWLPCLFVGIFIGCRIDDWFAMTYVGIVAIACLFYLVIVRLLPIPPKTVDAKGLVAVPERSP